MTVTLYAFEDRDGNEFGTFNTLDYAEAKHYASANNLRVLGREFEYADTVYLDDFTGNGEASEDEEADDDGD